MVMDDNGRSHRPSGLPKGYAGTFDSGDGGDGGGNDVTPPNPLLMLASRGMREHAARDRTRQGRRGDQAPPGGRRPHRIRAGGRDPARRGRQHRVPGGSGRARPRRGDHEEGSAQQGSRARRVPFRPVRPYGRRTERHHPQREPVREPLRQKGRDRLEPEPALPAGRHDREQPPPSQGQGQGGPDPTRTPLRGRDRIRERDPRRLPGRQDERVQIHQLHEDQARRGRQTRVRRVDGPGRQEEERDHAGKPGRRVTLLPENALPADRRRAHRDGMRPHAARVRPDGRSRRAGQGVLEPVLRERESGRQVG